MPATAEGIAKADFATANQVKQPSVLVLHTWKGSCLLFKKKHVFFSCVRACTGYFGTDCSLSYGNGGKVEVLAGLGYRQNKRGPLVYVYELPPEYHVK